MFKKIIAAAIIAVALYGVVKYPSIKKIAYTGTGFSAKNVCSGHFISGFSNDLIVNQALLPIDATFGYISNQIDEEKLLVSSRIFGLFERVAVYNEATGCQLLSIANTNTGNRTSTQYKQDLKSFSVAKTEKLKTHINSKIESILDEFFTSKDDSFRRSKSVLVWHKGAIIGEKYASGVTAETPLLSWSMAKSITNMLVGILVKQGQLNIQQTTGLTEWNNKPQHQQITIDHLLRMSSGLEFNETYGIGSDAAIMLSIAPSAGQYAANKPLEFPVDSHWSYSSGTSNILSLIIQRVISDNPQIYYQFAQQYLFNPLGISSAVLETDATGTIIGSSYMYATTRDWARLGLLMLNDGQWKGQRILPQGWVKYSTTASSTDWLNHYGAHFWLNYNPSDGKKQRVWPMLPSDAFYMAGFQGQRVVIIPSKQLVVVRMGFTTPGINNGVEQLIANIIRELDLKKSH
ncbi:MAG: serine hydrolase [Enterobacterales bacterium]|nr:serine hydrolase [Enterobacterales bacterium]